MLVASIVLNEATPIPIPFKSKIVKMPQAHGMCDLYISCFNITYIIIVIKVQTNLFGSVLDQELCNFWEVFQTSKREGRVSKLKMNVKNNFNNLFSIMLTIRWDI